MHYYKVGPFGSLVRSGSLVPGPVPWFGLVRFGPLVRSGPDPENYFCYFQNFCIIAAMENIIIELAAVAYAYAKDKTNPSVYSKMDKNEISQHQRIIAMGYAFNRVKINAAQQRHDIAQLWEGAFWHIHGAEK